MQARKLTILTGCFAYLVCAGCADEAYTDTPCTAGVCDVSPSEEPAEMCAEGDCSDHIPTQTAEAAGEEPEVLDSAQATAEEPPPEMAMAAAVPSPVDTPAARPAVAASAAAPAADASAAAPAAAASAAASPPAQAAPARGPRPLPPTFVQLELERFPRPADEACQDNTEELHVSQGESIQAALEQAAPGTTIWVEPGTYQEAATSDTALTWETPNVCLRADGDGQVVLQAAPGMRRGILPWGDDTVIEGFTLRGFVTGVAFWTGDGETLRNVTLERVTVEQGAGPMVEGIAAYGDNGDGPSAPPTVAGLLLLDVNVEGTDLGVSCNNGPCHHWWIERTRISGRRGFESSGADAFAIEEGRQIVVLDSTVSGSGADGIDTKATDVVVYGSKVLNVARNGIKLWRGGDVINTAISGSGADTCLAGGEAGRYRYLHVVVANHGPGTNAYVGTWAYGPREPVQLEVVNSIFYNNASGGFFAPAGSQLSFRHNMFGTEDCKLLELDDGTVYSGADLHMLEGDGHGELNFVGDPQLVDPANGVFETQPGSPAQDQGEVVQGLPQDIEGNPRRQGSAPDIGAAESR